MQFAKCLKNSPFKLKQFTKRSSRWVLKWALTPLALLGLLICPIQAVDGSGHDEGASNIPLTLDACYQLALKRSEVIAIQHERLKETESRFLQAFSGVLPRVSFSSSDKRQEDIGGSSSFTLPSVPERHFTFTQPLFRGFKEFKVMAGSRAEHRQRTHDQARAEQLLLLDVVEAFSLLVQQREDLYVLETTRLTLLERLDEIKTREQLGRSRSSEVASAEAQLRRVEAEWQRVNRLEVTARQLLEFLTGQEPIRAVDANVQATPMFSTEESYVAQAPFRADVQAAKEAYHVAHKLVGVARSDFWPDVDLESSYYTKRAGVSEDIDWDVTLTVDVPIFQGGETLGAVREAKSKARQSKLAWELAQREAELEIRDLHAQLSSARKRYQTLKQAETAAALNYRLQLEDYQRNLVSHLEVLEALQEFQDVRRDVIGVKHDAQRLSWKLRVATGQT